MNKTKIKAKKTTSFEIFERTFSRYSCSSTMQKRISAEHSTGNNTNNNFYAVIFGE